MIKLIIRYLVCFISVIMLSAAIADSFNQSQDPLAISYTQQDNIHTFDLLNLNQQAIGQLTVKLSDNGGLSIYTKSDNDQSSPPACYLELTEPNLYLLTSNESSCYFQLKVADEQGTGRVSIDDGNKAHSFDLKEK